MKMIYCNNCERYLDEDEVIKTRNTVPYGLGEVYESTETECPYCGSNDLVKDI